MKDEIKAILEDYKKAFNSYYRNNTIVDMDDRVGVRFDWILIRLNEVLPVLGLNSPPFRHSKFTIIYVAKGEGHKTIGSVHVPLKNRTLMVVPARTLTATTYSEDIRGYHLSFNMDFFLQNHFPRYHILQLNLFNQHVTPFAYPNPRQGRQLTEIFETILEEQDEHKKNKQELIALKILELIIVCDRQLKLEKGVSEIGSHPLMVRYINLIQKQYKKQHATNYYAKQLHVHPNSLNAAAKRYLGQSAKAVIATKLLHEAKHLLQLTTLSVKEIAYDLGFQSASQFFRFFKRHSGFSPVAYRMQYLKM